MIHTGIEVIKTLTCAQKRERERMKKSSCICAHINTFLDSLVAVVFGFNRTCFFPPVS